MARYDQYKVIIDCKQTSINAEKIGKYALLYLLKIELPASLLLDILKLLAINDGGIFLKLI